LININQWLWIFPATLLIIAFLQILYILALRLTLEPTSKSAPPPKPVKMPGAQTMETTKAVPTLYGGGYAEKKTSQPPVVMPTPVPQTQYMPPPSTGFGSQPSQPGASTQLESVKKFVILSGVQEPAEITFPSSNFGIGRYYNLESNIVAALDEKSVSRKHAVFIGDDKLKVYYVMDTNSSYGTFLLIDDRFEPLTPGTNERVYNEDVLQFGNSVKVRIILPCETRSSTTRV
jgi:hypothetical protein